MPGIDYAAVRREIPISRVLELIGYPYEAMRQQGVQLRGPCPLSSTCTPQSFSVQLQRNLFQCFHCGAGGNQLDLWAAIKDMLLHPATEHLCHQAGIAVPWINRSGAIRNR